jgi:hypothetical protein
MNLLLRTTYGLSKRNRGRQPDGGIVEELVVRVRDRLVDVPHQPRASRHADVPLDAREHERLAAERRLQRGVRGQVAPHVPDDSDSELVVLVREIVEDLRPRPSVRDQPEVDVLLQIQQIRKPRHELVAELAGEAEDVVRRLARADLDVWGPDIASP